MNPRLGFRPRALAAAILVMAAAAPVAAQVDPLLFLKTAPPNVVFVVAGACRRIRRRPDGTWQGFAPSRVGRVAHPQGQGGFREYGVPNTAASVAEGFSLRTTTSSASPDRCTRVKSRYRP